MIHPRRRRREGGAVIGTAPERAKAGRPLERVPAPWRSDSGAGDVLLAGYRESRNPALKDRLLRTYMPVARSLAWRYRKGPEPLEDLIQVACLGLVKAFDGFDPARGRSFLPYAQATIRGELLRHLRDCTGLVKLPRPIHEAVIRVDRLVEAFSCQRGHPPTIDELAERLGLARDEVVEVLRASAARRTASLDRWPVKTGGKTEAAIRSPGAVEPGYEAVEVRLAVEDGLAELRDPERNVLRLRFLEGLTQREVAKRIGVSQVQVSRIQRAACGRLLASLRGNQADEQGE